MTVPFWFKQFEKAAGKFTTVDRLDITYHSLQEHDPEDSIGLHTNTIHIYGIELLIDFDLGKYPFLLEEYVRNKDTMKLRIYGQCPVVPEESEWAWKVSLFSTFKTFQLTDLISDASVFFDFSLEELFTQKTLDSLHRQSTKGDRRSYYYFEKILKKANDIGYPFPDLMQHLAETEKFFEIFMHESLITYNDINNARLKLNRPKIKQSQLV